MGPNVTLETELRKLRLSDIDEIGHILAIQNSWQHFMNEIDSPTKPGKKRFNRDDIKYDTYMSLSCFSYYNTTFTFFQVH